MNIREFNHDLTYNKITNETRLALRPSYWAAVSGGKDSLYMLNLILHNLDKYPLSGVVHFELEIDFPFIHKVIDYMESECKRYNIPFYRIKPRVSWYELYNKYNFPTRVVRWCVSKYKLDAKKQLDEMLKSSGYYSVSYIGYCLDEEKRYRNKNTNKIREVFPLVEQGINESTVLNWAKNQTIFDDFYKYNRRCGCMFCPLQSMMSTAYLLKYYPEKYCEMIRLAKETEKKIEKEKKRKFSVWGEPKYNTDYRDRIVRTKWVKKLEEKSNQQN